MKNIFRPIMSWRFALAILQAVFLYIPLSIYVRLFGTKDIWLICERSTEARDNGFVLYKWIRENYPGQKIIYAIRRRCKDYSNVVNLGRVVEFGSLKHWYYFFAAEAICDTSWDICCPNRFTFLIMRKILPMKNKRVFLQHGITKDYMSQGRKNKLFADLFVCGAYPEWEYISKDFGYTNGEVRYLGFPRFDRLIDTSNVMCKQILFIPTWRMHLNGVKDFENTEYYIRIISFLKSEKLKKMLEENNAKLVFFLHPAIKEKKHLFNSVKHDRISLLNNEDSDMQEYLCSCNLLITDYSSVYFDIAYQNKPVIYYQYDYDEYRKGHYSAGYYDYHKDGFGPVVTTEEELMTQLNLMLTNTYQDKELYIKRIERFFPLRDNHNCKRNYEAIKSLFS